MATGEMLFTMILLSSQKRKKQDANLRYQQKSDKRNWNLVQMAVKRRTVTAK